MLLHLQIQDIVQAQQPKFKSISIANWEHKPSPEKWSKKEILGHLIDSAQNNLQRIIRAQYEHAPEVIYDQNQFVKINQYQNMDVVLLTSLWVNLNQQFIHTAAHISQESMRLCCRFGDDLETIKWVIEDYISHLEHHLNQVNN